MSKELCFLPVQFILSVDPKKFVASLYTEFQAQGTLPRGKKLRCFFVWKWVDLIIGEVVPNGSKERISLVDHKPCRHFKMKELCIGITTMMLGTSVDPREPLVA